jgi:hypothetical protein
VGRAVVAGPIRGPSRSGRVMLVRMSLHETRLPATFTVGADAEWIRGGGRLTGVPGQLVFMPDAVTRRLGSASPVEHASRSVRLVRARWIPPWFNVSIQLRGTEGSCLVVLPSWSRRRLREALLAAGFDVEDVTTRLDRKRWP